MFESIANFFRKLVKAEGKQTSSKDTAKERLHLVLMQDRANVSADFMELMKQEIIEVIKKYIEVEETAIDVRLTNEVGEDGVKGAPSLYANIPIINIKNDIKKNVQEDKKVEDEKVEDSKEKATEENKENIEEVEDKEEEVQEDTSLEEMAEEAVEENDEEKEIEDSTEIKEEKIEDEKSIEEEKPDKNSKEEDKENNTTEKEEK